LAFYGRPVLNQRGAFDDRDNPAEKFLGGWVQRALGSGPGAPTINVFFLSRDRNRAVYEQGVAAECCYRRRRPRQRTLHSHSELWPASTGQWDNVSSLKEN
jgi:hypothetical protein